MASTVVVTAFPLLLSKKPKQAAHCGGVLLMMSVIAFITAFLIAGFVTVGYKASPPSCASLTCTKGGIRCEFDIKEYHLDRVGLGNVNVTVFGMDSNVAALNSIANSSSEAICVRFDKAISHGNYSTLFPWSFSWDLHDKTGSLTAQQFAIEQLLTDQMTQLQTVCFDVGKLPDIVAKYTKTNFTVNVTGDITDLPRYLSSRFVQLVPVAALFPTSAFSEVHPYAFQNYFCMSDTTTSSMQVNVLCDSSAETAASNLSVSKSGQFIRAVTASDSGAVLFDADLTAQQVSKVITGLGGSFAFICVAILGFFLKTKYF